MIAISQYTGALERMIEKWLDPAIPSYGPFLNLEGSRPTQIPLSSWGKDSMDFRESTFLFMAVGSEISNSSL